VRPSASEFVCRLTHYAAANKGARVNRRKDFHRHHSRVVGFSQRNNGEQVWTPCPNPGVQNGF
jgi:hypothetical protein